MRKFISVLLALTLVLSFTTVAFSAYHVVDDDATTSTDALEAAGVEETATVYFMMPNGHNGFTGADGNYAENWFNDYNELDGQHYAGIYWWQSTQVNPDAWPGYRAEIENAEQGIYSALVPVEYDDVAGYGPATIIWNNGIDGGQDKKAPEYTAAKQTANITNQGLSPEESDSMPEGTPVYDEDTETGTFDGCIFVVDPDSLDVNPFSGKSTIDGEWYIYYGDGCFGSYAPTSDEFVSVEDNCLNPSHFDEDGNHVGYHEIPTEATEVTEPTEVPTDATDEPTEVPTEATESDFYLIGSKTGWEVSADYRFVPNTGVENEYVLKGVELAVDDQFKVVMSADGASKDMWFPDGMGNNYGEHNEITAAGTYNIYFRPYGDGDDAWFYNVIYVELASDEPTEVTEPTEEPEPVASNFYLVGNITDWSVIEDAKYNFVENTGVENEYVLKGFELAADTQFKVVYKNGDTQIWMPDGMGNNYGEHGEITVPGTYDIYFRPYGDGDDAWFYNVIYVDGMPAPIPTEPTEATDETEVPTDATDEPTEVTEPTEVPEPVASDFYLVGNITDWSVIEDAKYNFVENTGVENEYVLKGFELAADTQFKVVYKNGDTQIWFPDGMGNNYGEHGEITAAGTYDIYFRPYGDGDDAWFYNVIYVDGMPDPIPTEPTDATDEPTEATDEPTEVTEPTDEPEPVASDFYLVGNITDWSVIEDAKYNFVENTGVENEYVLKGFELAADTQFKVVYKNGDTQIWFPDGMGNNYGEHGEITAAGTYDIYFRPYGDGDDAWFYNVIYVDGMPDPIPTEPTEATDEPTEVTEPTDEPEPVASDFYLVGNITDWSVIEDAKYNFVENTGVENEYVLKGFELAADTQFKVVYKNGDTQIWFPDGMGNNYGEHGEITAAGTYDIYFRPYGDGDDAWFYNVIYVDGMPDPEPVTYKLGDANNDGDVDSVDAAIIQRYATDIDTGIEEAILMQGNVNGDEDLDLIDATFIQRYDTDLHVDFPIGTLVTR